jgi:membrane-associated phospholipid phosphatase
MKVHYPFDVVAGALYGSLIGYLGHRYIYLRISKLIQA